MQQLEKNQLKNTSQTKDTLLKNKKLLGIQASDRQNVQQIETERRERKYHKKGVVEGIEEEEEEEEGLGCISKEKEGWLVC